MPLKLVLYTVFFCSILLWGCSKEEIISPEIYGTWTYKKVQLLGANLDTTVAFEGKIVFEKSTRTYMAGGTQYGKDLSAKAELPLVHYNPAIDLYKVEREIFFGNEDRPRNFNYKDTFEGVFGWELVTGLNTYNFLQMSRPEANKIYLKIEADNPNRFTPVAYYFIELTR